MAEDERDAVKRNLNFHEAFKNQKHSQVPKGPGVLATMGSNKSAVMANEKDKEAKRSHSKTHRSKLTNSY